MEDLQTPIRNVVSQLNQPIPSTDVLLSLLTAPLAALHILPSQYAQYNANPIPSETISVEKHLPQIQKAILEHILPTWSHDSHVNDLSGLYFYSQSTALYAYEMLLSVPFTSHSVGLLTRLATEYSLDQLHSLCKGEFEWEECIRNVLTVPTKVANWCFTSGQEIPKQLQIGVHFERACLSCEKLIDKDSDAIPLINRLTKLGVFPSTPPSSRSQASFWLTVLPVVRKRLANSAYNEKWKRVFRGLSASALVLRSVLTSLATSLEVDRVRREIKLLNSLIPLDSDELVESMVGIILNPVKEWNEVHARMWVGLFALSRSDRSVQTLYENTLSIWCSPEHIKYSLLGRHHLDITFLLLLTTTQLSGTALNTSRFINAVSLYISQMDNSVRKCGMLVAEIVAERAGKKLAFGCWEGDAWAERVRGLINEKLNVEEEDEEEVIEETKPEAEKEKTNAPVKQDTNPDADSDDDSLLGYPSSPASSRSASPTPSELDEIAQDPALNVGKKKVVSPVYLAQLGAMLRGPIGLTDGGSNASEEADKIDIALSAAEELIRRKKGFGTELDENAVNLAHGLIGLQDNYSLKDFEGRRQRALNALVACCPTKVAICLIEEFLKNQYSSAQRYAMLNALALGARELAGLIETSAAASFPSKRLPPAQDRKYITGIVQDVARHAIERGKQDAVERIPELVRERRLRVKSTPKIAEINEQRKVPPEIPTPPQTTFNQVAAEYFILPLINRFWLFLRDEMTREERTQHLSGRAKYVGTGTGLVLNPLVLAHLLRTVAVLTHLSRNAMEWLSVIAPAGLELGVVLGTRRIGYMEGDDDSDDEGGKEGEGEKKEAAVLTAALELSLVVLDGCIELDRGRTLSLENGALVIGAGEWANTVLVRMEGNGARVAGSGGMEEVNLKRAAAGVVLKVEEIKDQWSSSMIDYL
ncbi:telomeric dna binding protein [Moniliophthora roreri]|nr:telomeric dna binding protein [Moniliophthora roreri]